MNKIIIVGLGGAIGAVLRYGISLIPVKTDFPLLTLCTNLMGAFVIGVVVGLAGEKLIGENWTLFLKTGVCGGFTTFSTFSLEAYWLLEKHRLFEGGIYIVCSVLFCMLGVALGLYVGKIMAQKLG